VDNAFITMMNMAQHQKYPLAKKLVFGLPSIAMALLIFSGYKESPSELIL